MSGISHTSVHVDIPVDRRRRRVTVLTGELKSRRYAGDFSHRSPTVLENGPTTPPDDDDGMQRIPSTSTATLDDDAVTVYTSSSGTLTTSPNVGCINLSIPSQDVYEKGSLTEAQRIATQYRQRHHSSPDVLQSTAISEPAILDVSSNLLKSQCPFPSSSGMQSGVCVDR